MRESGLSSKFAPVAVAAAAAGGVAIFITLCCGEAPRGELPPAWELRVALPDKYSAIEAVAARGSDLYIATREGLERIILKYDGRSFVKVYTVPEEYYEYGVWFRDMAFVGAKGWAVGGTQNPTPPPFYLPFMVRFDGGRWAEVEITDKTLGSLNEIHPINEDDCWLAGGENYLRGGQLLKYEGGEFKKYPRAGYICFARDSGVIYLPKSRPQPTVFVSADGGASWTEEAYDVDDFGYIFESLGRGWAFGEELHLLATYRSMVYGIAHRTGPPGEGVYELAFLEVNDPAFAGLRVLAFDDAGRGVGVGKNAAVYFDGTRWHREELREPVNFDRVTPAAGKGFWASGRALYNPHGPAGIYFHP
ncbi:MAG: hypothetical protein V3T41_05910 [bacterium]